MDCGGGLGNSIHAPLLQVRTLYFRRHLQAIVIEKAKQLENLLEKIYNHTCEGNNEPNDHINILAYFSDGNQSLR